ncbi:MAG: ATPase [Bacteroidales bacterium]|nr:ATPase [Bacteroidales bacterium]
MKIIADSGSTKTEWSLIDDKGNRNTVITAGINPFYQSTQEILENLQQDFSIRSTNVQEIFFYGAGCANPEKNKIVENALSAFFKAERIVVESDLLGAARSLCQDKEGIVCILGTGSNSCYYNGNKIEKNVSPLGYKLGDEGSGAVIGEKLIADILKKQLSEETIKLFFETYKILPSEIMDNVYQKKFPNRYLAQFTKFITEHIDIKELEDIVLFCFGEFVRRNLKQYANLHALQAHFTGSVAFYFQAQLKKTAIKNNLIIGNITKSPMEGLIKYHN